MTDLKGEGYMGGKEILGQLARSVEGDDVMGGRVDGCLGRLVGGGTNG